MLKHTSYTAPLEHPHTYTPSTEAQNPMHSPYTGTTQVPHLHIGYFSQQATNMIIAHQLDTKSHALFRLYTLTLLTLQC